MDFKSKINKRANKQIINHFSICYSIFHFVVHWSDFFYSLHYIAIQYCVQIYTHTYKIVFFLCSVILYIIVWIRVISIAFYEDIKWCCSKLCTSICLNIYFRLLKFGHVRISFVIFFKDYLSGYLILNISVICFFCYNWFSNSIKKKNK